MGDFLPLGKRCVDPLPARYYFDETVFEQEQTSIFSKTWQYAGHQCAVASPGQYITFEIAGQSLVTVHGRDGIIRTFYNVCKHRAHLLAEGCGAIRSFVCPYHAWTYELNGELRSGPNLLSFPMLDRSRFNLTEVRTEVFHGFIFVNLDPDAATMDEWYPGAREYVGEYLPQVSNLAPLQMFEVPQKCNWKVALDNYSECYHCPVSHPSYIKTGMLKTETYTVSQFNGGYSILHKSLCNSLDAMSHQIDRNRAHAEDYSVLYLWPAFSFQIYPGNLLNTYHWRVPAVDTCTMWRGWYTEHGAPDEAISEIAHRDRTTLIEEDIRLVESVQQGLRNKGFDGGALLVDPEDGLYSEVAIAMVHDWIREALTAHG